MRLCLFIFFVTATPCVGCASPLCGAEYVEQAGRCVTLSVVEATCEPACSAPAHRVCDGDHDTPSCICAPGYEGDPCTWAGVLEDPGFEKEEGWILSEGAVIDGFEEGPTGDGIALLRPRSACFGGRVSQLVEMPSYEVGEPLVAEVVYKAQGSFGLSVGFDRAWTQLPPSENDAWSIERVCLGEAAYGGEALVQISGAEQHPTCFEEPVFDVEVDRLDIIPADQGECPAPGEVLNGTADGGKGGWDFSAINDGDFEFVPGEGHEGTSGARLSRGTGDFIRAWTKMSVPSMDTLPSPALRFWWKGTSGLPFQFEIGRTVGDFQKDPALPLDEALGNSELNYLYCLPPWTHGNVVDLIFEAKIPPSSEPSSLVVDNIELISEPACGDSTDVLDPGFEAGRAPGVRVTGVTNADPSTASIRLVTDASLARSGNGVLEISYSNQSVALEYEIWVLVPESQGREGPAVFYWSDVSPLVDEPFQTRVGRAAVDPADVPVGIGWNRSDAICLTPEWAGRWFRVKFDLGERPPLPDQQLAPRNIYIDDIEVTTSSTCPSN